MGHEGVTHLCVPPPAQQRPVRDPRLDAVLAEGVQVGADHVHLRVALLGVADPALEEAGVVVAQQVVGAHLVRGRLVEVLFRVLEGDPLRLFFPLGFLVGRYFFLQAELDVSVVTGEGRGQGQGGGYGGERCDDVQGPHRAVTIRWVGDDGRGYM